MTHSLPSGVSCATYTFRRWRGLLVRPSPIFTLGERLCDYGGLPAMLAFGRMTWQMQRLDEQREPPHPRTLRHWYLPVVPASRLPFGHTSRLRPADSGGAPRPGTTSTLPYLSLAGTFDGQRSSVAWRWHWYLSLRRVTIRLLRIYSVLAFRPRVPVSGVMCRSMIGHTGCLIALASQWCGRS